MSMRRRHLPLTFPYQSGGWAVWQGFLAPASRGPASFAQALGDVGWITIHLTRHLWPVFPERALPCQPALHLDQWRGGKVAGAHAPLLDRTDDPALLQHTQMAHEGRQGHRMGCMQGADRRRPAGKLLNDRAPCGVGHCAEEKIKSVRHGVYRRFRVGAVQSRLVQFGASANLLS